MLGLLLAGIIVCGETTGPPAADDPPCPIERQDKLCGCRGPMTWDYPESGTAVRFVIERKFLYRWDVVGTVPVTRRWWSFLEDRPLPLPEFHYQYRIWAEAADGTRSLAPSNIVRYVGIPLTCVDDVTYKKVACPYLGGAGGN